MKYLNNLSLGLFILALTAVVSRAQSDSVPIIAVDSAALLIGKASLNAVDSRLTAVHSLFYSFPGEFRPVNTWHSGLVQDDKLGTGVYDGAKSRTIGAQTGVDACIVPSDWGFLSLGAFVDYAQNNMNYPQPAGAGMTKAMTKAAGGGFYLECWLAILYWEIDAHYAREACDITTPGTGTFRASGNSYAASLAIGCVPSVLFETTWVLEPQVRLTWQTHQIGNLADPVGRVYNIGSADSFETRATVHLSRSFDWRKGATPDDDALCIAPYIRAGLTCEFRARNNVHVYDTSGAPILDSNGAPVRYDNNLSGAGPLVEAGALMHLGRGFYTAATLTWYKTSKLESHALEATLGRRW